MISHLKQCWLVVEISLLVVEGTTVDDDILLEREFISLN